MPLWGTWVQTSWDDASAAEEQQKKAAALPAPWEHLLSAGHRWALEPALPLQQGQAELSALVGAQSMLQTSAKRAAHAAGCSPLLPGKPESCHGGGRVFFLGEMRLPRAPRTEERHQGAAIRVNCFDVQ